MYRHPKFLEVLHEIREDMSREAGYDILRLAEIARNGQKPDADSPTGDDAQSFDEVQKFEDRRKPQTEDQDLIYGNRF